MGWFTTVPASFMLDLGTSMKMRMLSLSDADIKKFQEVNPGFVKHVIPKATYAQYGIEEDVVTIQAPTVLIAHAKTPADVVYKITKAIVEGREDFARVTAAMKGVTAKDMAAKPRPADASRRREVLQRGRAAEVNAPLVRKLTGYAAGVVGVVGVVMSLYHVYARLTPPLPDGLVLRIIALAFCLALAFLLFPFKSDTPLDEESTRLETSMAAPTTIPWIDLGLAALSLAVSQLHVHLLRLHHRAVPHGASAIQDGPRHGDRPRASGARGHASHARSRASRCSPSGSSCTRSWAPGCRGRSVTRA
jgi:hypothetical protein